MESDIKTIVKEKYAEIAVHPEASGCCCGCGPQIIDVNMIGDDYNNVKGHVKEADLDLGCGIPTNYAALKPGDTVLDLGSGAGNDVFIASQETGPNGFVIGVDMTPAMIERANKNKAKLNFTNVDFRLGDIEDLPVDSDSVDVVLSNCVLNLVPDKVKAFSEIYRVLKSGAHFCISDVVVQGALPEGFKRSAEMYAGCIAGALQREEYLSIIEKAGFNNIEVVKSKIHDLPEKVYKTYLSDEEYESFRKNDLGIFSITVKAVK